MERLEELKKRVDDERYKMTPGRTADALADAIGMISELEGTKLNGETRQIVRRTVYKLHEKLIKD